MSWGHQEALGPDGFENKMLALKGNSVGGRTPFPGTGLPKVLCSAEHRWSQACFQGGAWLRLPWALFRRPKPGVSWRGPPAPLPKPHHRLGFEPLVGGALGAGLLTPACFPTYTVSSGREMDINKLPSEDQTTSSLLPQGPSPRPHPADLPGLLVELRLQEGGRCGVGSWHRRGAADSSALNFQYHQSLWGLGEETLRGHSTRVRAMSIQGL